MSRMNECDTSLPQFHCCWVSFDITVRVCDIILHKNVIPGEIIVDLNSFSATELVSPT